MPKHLDNYKIYIDIWDMTTEKAFEAYIQRTMSSRGWIPGSADNWDEKLWLFPEYVNTKRKIASRLQIVTS